jgi:UDP-3-O-[3-hydroxymyristoyl] glucosamine N-acyltransferase
MPARLGELAVRFGCELVGDPDVVIDTVATLQDASPGSLAFLANTKYRKHPCDDARIRGRARSRPVPQPASRMR